MPRFLPPDVEQLTSEQLDVLLTAKKGFFQRLPSSSGIWVGMLHDDLETVSLDTPCLLRPDRLPKDSLTFDLVRLIPITQDRTSIGWVVKVPNLPHKVCDHFVSVKRRGVVINERDKMQTKLVLKNITALSIPDTAVVLLSTMTKDVRT